MGSVHLLIPVIVLLVVKPGGDNNGNLSDRELN